MSNKLLQRQSWPTLVIFCKRPKLGQGKQRLAKTLGSEQALIIAKAILACALEDANAWRGEVVLAISSASDVAWARSLLPEKAQVISQGEGNLGVRINNIDKMLRADGHTSTVYIGTDAPNLSYKHYQHICSLLANNATAFSRAEDGGVTIMANGTQWPNLESLPWSTDTLGERLINLSNTMGSIGFTETSYDIDVEADLAKLKEDLVNDTRPARKALFKLLMASQALKTIPA